MSDNSFINQNQPAPGIVQLRNSQIIVDAQGIIRVIPLPPNINLQRQAVQFPPYDALAAASNRNDHYATIPSQPAIDTTSQHPYEQVNEENLHPLHFQLEPPPDPLQGINLVPLLYNTPTNLVEVAPDARTPLRHFSFLPRWIERNVSKALLELWFRLDPRLQPSDIVHRMRLNNAGNAVTTNSINTKRMRMRELLNIPGWHRSHQYPTPPELAPLNHLSADQLRLNTAMLVDLQNNRLLQPVIHRQRVLEYIDSGLPIDYFIRTANGQLFTAPGSPMAAALVLRRRLQTLALIQDPSNNAPANYMKLAKEDKPSWWKDNKKGSKTEDRGRSITEIDDQSHDEFMERCLANSPADQSRWMHRKSNRSNAPSDAARKGKDEATTPSHPTAMANQMMPPFRFGPAPPAQPLPPALPPIIALPPGISWADLTEVPDWFIDFPDEDGGEEEGEEEDEDSSEEGGGEGMEEVFEL